MNTPQTQWRTLIIAIGVMVLLVVINAIGGLRWLEHSISIITEPGTALIYRVVDRLQPLYGDSASMAVTENDSLKQELARLAESNVQLTQQVESLNELRNQLTFAETQPVNALPAQLISRVGEDGTAQIITINRGKQDGVIEGLPVVYNDGGLLGVVQSVSDSYSEVALLTSGLVSIQAQVQSDPPTKGLITGQFGVSLNMEYILKDSTITNGQAVVTTGADQYVPAGLLLGTVQSVEESSSELFKTATVLPTVRYSPQSIVTVYLPQ